MANKTTQLKYNQVIDTIAYLILNHPEALKKLFADYRIDFKGNPSPNDLGNLVIEKLERGDIQFQKALENLILRLSTQGEDQFLGGLIKGAIGLVGGIIKGKKAKRQSRKASAAAAREEQSYANSQASAAKRDLEMRMQRLREQQRQREEQARIRREQEQRRRKEEASKREAEAKTKTNMMLMVGGGIAILGIGAVVLMKSNRPPMPYPQMRPTTMPI